jgi:hypothetical protein
MDTDPSDAGEFRFDFQLKDSESGNGGDQGASQAKSRGGGSGGKAQSGRLTVMRPYPFIGDAALCMLVCFICSETGYSVQALKWM